MATGFLCPDGIVFWILMVLSVGLLLARAWLKETEIVGRNSHGSITYFMSGNVTGPVQGITLLCTSTATRGGIILGDSIYSPWLTCSASFNISTFVDPKRVLMEGCSGSVTLAVSAHLTWESLSCSLLLMAAALWSRHSNKKRPHSWQWAVFQSRCSLLNSVR